MGFEDKKYYPIDYGLWKDFIGVLVPRDLGSWQWRARGSIKSLL